MHSYWEQQRFDVLLYYIGGKMRDPEHNESVIRQLQDLGYLGSLNTPSFAETMRTTPNGLVYLKCMGFDVDAPDIVDGRLLMKQTAR